MKEQLSFSHAVNLKALMWGKEDIMLIWTVTVNMCWFRSLGNLKMQTFKMGDDWGNTNSQLTLLDMGQELDKEYF